MACSFRVSEKGRRDPFCNLGVETQEGGGERGGERHGAGWSGEGRERERERERGATTLANVI